MRRAELRPSLRGRLLLLVLLTVLPAFGLIVHSAWEDWDRARAQAERQTRQLAAFVADEQGRLLAEARQMLTILSHLPIVRDLNLLPLCHETLARLRQQNPLYANIGVVDAQGNLLCSALPFESPINFSDREWFRRAVSTQDFAVGDYRVALLAKVPVVNVALPLYNDDGSLSRLVYAPLALSWFESLAEKLPVSPNTVLVVVDGQGTVLARHPDPHRESMGKPMPEKGLLESILSPDCKGFAEFSGSDGVMRLNAVEPLSLSKGRCVYVSVGVPRDELYSPVERRLWRNLGAMLVVSVLMFTLAWFGSDWFILRQVRALIGAARCLGLGDLTARTGLPHGGEELGQLAQSFDEMAARLEEREARLAAADRALTVLSAGNRAMLRATDESILLDDMCRLVVEKGGYNRVWIGFTSSDESRQLHIVAHFGFGAKGVDASCISWVESGSGECAVTAAVQRGEAVVARGCAGVLLASGAPMDPMTVLALPMRNEEGVFGVVAIYASRNDLFDRSEIELLGEAAADIAYGITRLRDQTRRKEAEQANRIKSEFLANMSHELRTPLNAIIGFSEVLKDGLVDPLTPPQQEYVIDIFESGRHLLSLINDILDLSKVEAGRMTLDLEDIAVNTLLENSLAIVKEKATAHRLVLTREVEENLDALRLDVRKTRQIVYNLLSNAVKFTPDGGRIHLRAGRVCRAAVESWSAATSNTLHWPLPPNDFTDFLEISVEDSGIGIGRDDAVRLFKPFSQIDSSLSRRYEGTGLGLAMVMKMVELHGGTVAVASESGQGSCFTVWLPWREAGGGMASAVLPVLPSPEGWTALVIEDNDTAAELVGLQLEAEGLHALRVVSAEEAMALVGSFQPAVIILDIFLPGMDGWDFLEALKRPDSPWVDVPVVIVSIVADARKGFALGASQVLQKPVGRDDLATALHRLGFGPEVERQGKVLIIDDDPKAVELLATHLAAPGQVVLRASGGAEGIGLARSALPDLILLDLIMPEVNGFDVVEALRADPATVAIPIIVVTAKQLTREDHERLNSAAVAIMAKADFQPGHLVAEVRRALATQAKETR
ncbi:MAG: response regulator [Magnetococcales bacterium]|nr:response regulator [Magnetococcales bacterium]